MIIIHPAWPQSSFSEERHLSEPGEAEAEGEA